MQQKVWEINNKWKAEGGKRKVDEIVNELLIQRGVRTKKQKDTFLHPKLESLIDAIPFPQMDKALKRIEKAIKSKEKIAIFSDYDADGICATAILWETIHELGGDVMPYVPDRIAEGYGLSVYAAKKLAEEKINLIITVDNGITAVEAVNTANALGVDIIITDHHQKPTVLPKPYAFVWSDKICGTVVAWYLAKALTKHKDLKSHLELAALATIADVMPLVDVNRTIVKFGLEELNKTKRVGLIALFNEAGLELGKVGWWEIGHVIAPRLNAMGRLENAMDSLRLLCTTNPLKAKSLAMTLARTNTERQKLTEKMVTDARLLYNQDFTVGVLAHETWHEGVVGLVAGRMTEAFYRPMIAIAKGEEFSKGSARSIPGFNIIEALRSLDGVFENIGGHPMAAGFTIRTENIAKLEKQLLKVAEKQLTNGLLQRKLRVDLELSISELTRSLYDALEQLSPFGNGNPEPIFVTRRLEVEEVKKVGSTGKHIKLRVCQADDGDLLNGEEVEADVTDLQNYFSLPPKPFFEAIGFGMGELLKHLRPGQIIDIAYTLSLNTWHDVSRIELKIKDMRFSDQ